MEVVRIHGDRYTIIDSYPLRPQSRDNIAKELFMQEPAEFLDREYLIKTQRRTYWVLYHHGSSLTWFDLKVMGYIKIRPFISQTLTEPIQETKALPPSPTDIRKFLVNKLAEIEESIDRGVASEKEGKLLYTIHGILKEKQLKDVKRKFDEIISKLFQRLQPEIVKQDGLIQLEEDVLIRKDRDRLEIIVLT